MRVIVSGSGWLGTWTGRIMTLSLDTPVLSHFVHQPIRAALRRHQRRVRLRQPPQHEAQRAGSPNADAGGLERADDRDADRGAHVVETRVPGSTDRDRVEAVLLGFSDSLEHRCPDLRQRGQERYKLGGA